MTKPWIAFSQYGGWWKWVSAGFTFASSIMPNSTPHTVPRPPLIATPPTTAAAIALSSSPSPPFGCTCGDCARFSAAAKPTSPPITAKAQKVTAFGRIPASRAASASLPVA